MPTPDTLPRAFSAALNFVLEKEGGYANDRADPGGETNFGVSKRAYPGLDIRNLTREKAADIYYRDYWLTSCCEALPPAVAFVHLDFAVNAGVNRAAKTLQAAAGVEMDGKIGPKTLAAVQRMRPAALVREYTARRLVHYGSLSTFERYGLGWSRRAVDCLSHALTMEA